LVHLLSRLPHAVNGVSRECTASVCLGSRRRSFGKALRGAIFWCILRVKCGANLNHNRLSSGPQGRLFNRNRDRRSRFLSSDRIGSEKMTLPALLRNNKSDNR